MHGSTKPFIYSRKSDSQGREKPFFNIAEPFIDYLCRLLADLKR